MKTKKSWKKVLAGTIALAVVSGTIPIIENFIPGSSINVLHADTTIPEDRSSAGGDEVYFVGFNYVTQGSSGNYKNSGEYLFDKDGGNKACIGFEGDYFVEFSYDTPIVPTRYFFRTGGDTSSFTRRNPSAWVLYGKNSADEWVEIDSKTDQSFTTEDDTAAEFQISNSLAFKDFKLVIKAINNDGDDDWPVDGMPTFQLSEVYMAGNIAESEIDLSDATYTLVIPASLTVKNTGWNDLESDVSAKGSIPAGTELVVSADSRNEWELRSGENAVKYKLAAEDQKEKSYDDATALTSFSFSSNDLKDDGVIYKAGIVVEDYSDKPAGNYEDVVTFTASIAVSSEPDNTPAENTGHSDPVEWDYSVIDPIGENSTYTKDGVTLTTTSRSKISGNFYDYGKNTFSSSVGNFTRIEMLSTYASGFPGATVESGVSFYSTQDERDVNGYRVVWTGNSNEVSFQADIYAVENIKFTFADSSDGNTSSSTTSSSPAILNGVMWKTGTSLDFGNGAYLKSTWWDETVQKLTGEISLNFIDTGNGDHYYCGVQTFGDYNLSNDGHLNDANYGLEIRGSGTEDDPYYGVPVHSPIE